MFRYLLVTVLLCTLPAGATLQADELGLGDRGYRHGEFHEQYKKLFTIAKCRCGDGGCRPTIYRPSKENLVDIEVYVSGRWCKVPPRVILSLKDLPKELREKLWREKAHVCAVDYPDLPGECPALECVVANAGM